MHWRPTQHEDQDALYAVCLATADAGYEDPADAMRFDDEQILGSVFVGPYVHYPDAIAFTLVDEGRPVGYLLAAPDTHQFNVWSEEQWWPILRARYPRPPQRTREGWTGDQWAADLIHSPTTMPTSMIEEYPAHFHIDLLASARGHGLAGDQVRELLALLTSADIPGVHLRMASGNANARNFYEHLGFQEVATMAGEVVLGASLNR